jgi:hypothetical protein
MAAQRLALPPILLYTQLVMAVFIWNEWNVAHIATHGVLPQEAEEVLRGASPPWPRNQGDGKFLVWGQTAAGRHLQVIFVLLEDEDVDWEALDLEDLAAMEEDEDIVYVIHAMPMTTRMRGQYRRQRGP